MDFVERMQRQGWLRCEKDDTIRTMPPMAGSSCWRRGPVRIELSPDYMSEHDFRVTMYAAFGKDTPTIAALVVDPISRKQGFGERALNDMCELLKEVGYKHVRLECLAMPRQGKPKMTDKQLRAWYERCGFAMVEGCHRVMEKVL